MPTLKPTEDIQPLTEFRANMASFIDQVHRTGRPLVLTHHGKSAAVLLGAGEYESLVDELETLRRVAVAHAEPGEGKGVPHEEEVEEVTADSVETRHGIVRRLKDSEEAILGLGVRRLALFGSFLRDEGDEESDVDLLVEFEPDQKSFDRFLELSELIEELLGREVELVTTEALSPFIGPRILAEAEDVIGGA